MSPKSTALARKPKGIVTIERPLFTSDKEGTFTGLTDWFKKEVLDSASALGGVLQTAQQKKQTAMNLTSTYKTWKEKNKGGLPLFVHNFIDPTCPTAYGSDPKSEERKKINAHSVFNGIRYMVETIGQPALKRLADATAKGIDPNDDEAIAKRGKQDRDKNAKAAARAFTGAIVRFDAEGVTEATVSNLIATVLKKSPKDEPGELTKSGKDLLEATRVAMFKRGKAATWHAMNGEESAS